MCAICDKRRVLETAPAFGIGVPHQAVLASAADVPHLPELAYPVVAKPSRSVAESGGVRHKLRVRHVASRAELARVVAELPDAAFPVLLQERVIGPGVGDVPAAVGRGAPRAYSPTAGCGRSHRLAV